MLSSKEFYFDTLCLTLCSKTPETRALVDAVLEIFEAEQSNDSTMNEEIAILYVTMIREIINGGIDVASDPEVMALITKYATSHEKNQDFFNSLKRICEHRDKISERRIIAMQQRLRNWIIWHRGNRTIRTTFSKSQKLQSLTDTTDQNTILSEMLEHARDLVKVLEAAPLAQNDTLDMINMSSHASVRNALIANRAKRDSGKLITGLQGMNRMFGVNGGPLLGEFIAFAALSHHYKSGMLMDMTRWLAMLNDVPFDPNGRIPTIVFISLENEVHENMMDWFRAAYRNIYKSSDHDLSDDQLIDMVVEAYSRKGYELLVYRKLGDIFGYEEWVKLHEELRAEGRWIIASVLDYITLMRLPNNQQTNDPIKRQQLAQAIGNYGNFNNMLVATGLQLGSAAQEMVDSKQYTNIVKRYGASHLANCRGFKRELDVLIYLHLEYNHRGVRYLTMQMDKHRYVNNTPAKHKYCAYPFVEDLGILDDIGGEPQFVEDIFADGDGAGTNGTTSKYDVTSGEGFF